jgi:hypothetical protein
MESTSGGFGEGGDTLSNCRKREMFPSVTASVLFHIRIEVPSRLVALTRRRATSSRDLHDFEDLVPRARPDLNQHVDRLNRNCLGTLAFIGFSRSHGRDRHLSLTPSQHWTIMLIEAVANI